MKWSLSEISKQKRIEFEAILDLSDELKSRSNEILSVSPISAHGQVTYDDGLYLLDYQLKTTLTLPSSRSLKPVELPLDSFVSEIFATTEHLTDSSDLIIPLEKDLISLDESLADNILLEIPLQILTKDEENDEKLPAGKFWTVLSEEDYQKQQEEKQNDKKSPFSSLDGLFE